MKSGNLNMALLCSFPNYDQSPFHHVNQSSGRWQAKLGAKEAFVKVLYTNIYASQSVSMTRFQPAYLPSLFLLVNSVHDDRPIIAQASYLITSRVGSGRDIAIQVTIKAAEEGRNGTSDKSTISVNILQQSRLHLARNNIKYVLQHKASDLADGHTADVDSERNEVVQALIGAELARRAEIEVHNIRDEVLDLVRGLATVPGWRECLVEEEWGDVGVVRDVQRGTVGQSAVYECALGMGDDEPFGAGEESGVRSHGFVVGNSLLFDEICGELELDKLNDGLSPDH